jgi:hypothetical protein
VEALYQPKSSVYRAWQKSSLVESVVFKIKLCRSRAREGGQIAKWNAQRLSVVGLKAGGAAM